MAPADISRRGFLFPWRRLTDAPPPEPGARPTAPTPAAEPFILRPPGALPEASFVAACEPCDACVEVCPAQAITRVAEGPARGTPTVVPSRAACLLCAGLRCTTVCPTGALRPVAAPTAVRMGTAELEPLLCTAYRGRACRVCLDVCPVPGALGTLSGARADVPVAGPAACVGCGLCEHHCPAPGAITVVAFDGGPGRVRMKGRASR